MKLFKRLFIEKAGNALNPKDSVSKNNALDTFLNTLTKEEQDGSFLKLSAQQQHQYVKALALFQIEAMGNLDDAATKSMNILAIRLHRANIEQFEIHQRFSGSKEDIQEEDFSFKISKIAKIPKNAGASEYADEKDAIEPKQKIEPLWNQQYAVLDIIHKVKEQIPTIADKDIPFVSSGVLLLAEYLSESNIETLNVTLENLIDKDVQLNVSFMVESTRLEKNYYLTPDNVGYTSRKPH